MSETFHNTLGAILIGGFVSIALFGVTCAQAFHYYQGYPEDSWYLKTLVAFVLLCDVVHMILTAQGLYWYLIVNFSNPNVVTLNSRAISASTIVTTISNTAIRILFARRIWILSRGSYALTLPLIFLIVIILIAGTGLAVITVLAVNYEATISQFWIYRTNFALIAAGELYFAICLCFLLRRSQIANGINKTNSLIRNLILYVISTSLVTGVTSIFCLTMTIVSPISYIWVGIYLPLSNLYCNAMLAMLNARQSLRSTDAVTSEQGIEVGASTRTGDTSLTRSDVYPLTNVK